jgi:hypothetical protein
MPQGQLVRMETIDRRWHMFAPPVLEAGDVDTFTTDFERPANLEDVAIDVDHVQKLRTRWFGRDADGEAASVQFIGYYEDGPGHKIGIVPMVLGTHDVSATFPDGMRNCASLMDPAKTWLEVDSFDITDNPESALSKVEQTNGTSWLTFDLSNALYRYILAEINVTTMLELGGIYIPIG